MANRGYLLNTSTLTSDPYLLGARLKEPGNDFLEAGESAYRIPVPWLLCFRPEDFHPVKVPVTGRDGGQRQDEIALPCTSVSAAIDNLSATLPIFQTLAINEEIGERYWRNAIERLRQLPLPYLTLSVLEVLYGNDPVAYSQKMIEAVSGGEAAMAALILLSGIENETFGAFAPDVLYVVSPDFLDETQAPNAVALDIACTSYWHLSPGTAPASRPALPHVMTLPSTRPNLLAIQNELTDIARIKVPGANIRFGWRSDDEDGALRLRLGAASDEACDALRLHRPFRKLLDGPIDADVQALCAAYGLCWDGYVFESDEQAKRAARPGLRAEYSWLEAPVDGPPRLSGDA